MEKTRLEYEKAYLETVKNAIQEEVIKQKETFERIPHEYKGRYANVKWGDEDLVKNMQDGIIRRLKKLANLPNNPYFGRIDFLADGSNDVAVLYIGKTTITDENNKMLTIDWRTPVCTLYYDQSIGRVNYDAPSGNISGNLKLKSQLLIENGEIVHVKDTDLVTADELLMPFLTSNADARLKNIVASIQEEQNSIIRMPLNNNIIVQGVAGSGKTTVALHRIAYLLYNNSNLSANNFAIIGPNKYFLNYISALLPDLETDNITQFTFEEIANTILENATIVPSDNDKALEDVLKYKSSIQYKTALDKYIYDYISNAVADGLSYEGYQLFSRNYLMKNFEIGKKFSTISDFLQKSIIQKIREDSELLEDKLTDEYSKQFYLLPKGDPQRDVLFDKMQEIRKEIRTGCANTVKKYFKALRPNIFSLYKDFLSKASVYVQLDQKSTLLLQKSTLTSLKKKEFSLEDLPALLHLQIAINGDEISELTNFKHLTIDEAQDFGLFHYYIIKKLFKKCSVSIFGDISQAIYPTRSISNWDELNKTIFDSQCQLLQLNRSYRTTMEITNSANSILKHLNMELANPVIRTGDDVSITEADIIVNNNMLLSLLQQYLDKKYKSIGIICKDESEMVIIKNELNAIGIQSNIISSEDSEYNSGICLLTSSLAKGLEFDAIIITNANKNKYNANDSIDMKLLYVAMTRALHKLDILYTGKLTTPLESELGKTLQKKDSVALVKSNLD